MAAVPFFEGTCYLPELHGLHPHPPKKLVDIFNGLNISSYHYLIFTFLLFFLLVGTIAPARGIPGDGKGDSAGNQNEGGPSNTNLEDTLKYFLTNVNLIVPGMLAISKGSQCLSLSQGCIAANSLVEVDN